MEASNVAGDQEIDAWDVKIETALVVLLMVFFM
jgi:hypothetical protein